MLFPPGGGGSGGGGGGGNSILNLIENVGTLFLLREKNLPVRFSRGGSMLGKSMLQHWFCIVPFPSNHPLPWKIGFVAELVSPPENGYTVDSPSSGKLAI